MSYVVSYGEEFADAAAGTEAMSASLAGVGELDPVAVDAGRLAGRVDVLLWCQSELQVELDRWKQTDRFADLRGLEQFLVRVQDSLRQVQDGSGTWAGLVRTGVEAAGVVRSADEAAPDHEMGA